MKVSQVVLYPEHKQWLLANVVRGSKPQQKKVTYVVNGASGPTEYGLNAVRDRLFAAFPKDFAGRRFNRIAFRCQLANFFSADQDGPKWGFITAKGGRVTSASLKKIGGTELETITKRLARQELARRKKVAAQNVRKMAKRIRRMSTEQLEQFIKE